jgi:Family of unknown function (DUF6489)
MKISIDIDCTPEEARRVMGLPDVEQVNSIYLDNMARMMKEATSVDQLQNYAAQLAPMGQAGLKVFQSLMESGAAFAAGATGKSAKD